MTKFKSLGNVNYSTERGNDYGQVEGTVIKIEKNKVYLSGLMFDFYISLNDFKKYNKIK